MNHVDVIAQLQQQWSALPAKDHEFAKSLVSQFNAKGTLSSKQWYWAEKLAAETTKPAAQPMPEEEVGGLAGLMDLFAKAKQHLKYPKIVLVSDETLTIEVSLLGPQSKTPGWVTVNSQAPYGQKQWFGRVSPEGVWHRPSAPDASSMTKVRRLLQCLSTDAAKTASEYGRLKGLCCFCNSQLTDEKSTSVGYGPTCAKRWGLPWGAKH